jgi:hypothetical protein
MKNKLLTVASLLAVINANAIEIGPTGSGIEFGGFIDVFYQSQDNPDAGDDGVTGTADDPKDDTLDVGQVELNFDFAKGPISASVDLDFGIDAEFNLEEAVLTYDFGNGFSVSGGKMLSYLGYEAYDPINMYQYSYAYDAADGLSGGQDIYDPYDDGISIDYVTDAFSVGVWTSAEEDGGFEYAFAYTGIENLTVKAIFADWGESPMEHNGTAYTGPTAYEVSTIWASYQLGKLLIAGEIAERDFEAGGDIDGFLLMGNYSITDSAALTVRYSEQEIEGTGTYEKFTISPSYVFNDAFSGLVEYSTYDETAGATEINDLFAVELIYTF